MSAESPSEQNDTVAPNISTTEGAARLTESELIDLLRAGKYPVALTFIPGQPARHIYPSAEVALLDTSKDTDPSLHTYQSVFQIRVYMRVSAAQGQTEEWLDLIEREMLRAATTGALQHGANVFAVGRGWRRRRIDRPFSIESTCRLSVRLVAPSEDGTVIGAGRVLKIAGQELELIGGGSAQRGRHSTSLTDALGDTVPVPGARFETRHFEYKWRYPEWHAIQQWCDYGALLKCEIIEPPVGGSAPDDERISERFLAMPVVQRDSANYAGLKTVVLELEASTIA